MPDDEKARIEFHLQQMAECIGFERFRLPILSEQSLLSGIASSLTTDQIKNLVGKHLGHAVREIRIESVPLPPEKCGGGG